MPVFFDKEVDALQLTIVSNKKSMDQNRTFTQ